MKELEKKLKELKKFGYETIYIDQVLTWIYEIEKENRLKRYLKKNKIEKDD